MVNKLYWISGTEAISMQNCTFEKEADLQQIVADNPNLVARSFDDAIPSSHYLVDKEYGITVLEGSNGELSLDHLMVDELGIPVLVEVKRSTDTRIKREVVAQMIDYACRASSWDIALLKNKFIQNNECEAIPERLMSDEFWSVVSDNLKSEHFRMVFVADSIPDTLKVMIEFLDRSMKDIEVYGVELSPYRSEEKLLLSQNFIGQPIPDSRKATSSRSAERRVWTESSFFSELNTVMGEKACDAVSDMISHLESVDLVTVFGTGSKLATITFRKNGSTVFGISQHSANGEFYIDFYKAYLDSLENPVSLDIIVKSINELYLRGMDGNFKSTVSGAYLPLKTLLTLDDLEDFYRIISSLL